MFRGTSQLTLDNKGRLVVPARHRDVLLERCGGHLVITADPDHCLLLYPLPEWEVIQQKLEGLSNLDKRVRELQRRLIGFAVDTEMDGAGRVLVAPELRKYAQLDKDVVLVGQGRKFELWAQPHWDSVVEAPGGLAPEGLPPQLEGLSL
ncbi:MAG: division/cell wall cluster transcriptional repressor MraZ [Betaproteobacteria bacterium]|nr:division/cell wall cluster transcriptional repressor MraZ [Betaproteobacteria bacterium]